MNEFELLARLLPKLAKNESVIMGAGDDCAVIDLGIPGKFLLFKTDALVEKVHFTLDAPPGKIGHKALARALSDIAAMAGEPVACLVTLGLPKKYDPEFVFAMYDGLNKTAAEHRIAVVGGETTAVMKEIFISVALIGAVPKDRLISRSGALPGDAIFVTGELGGSISGRHLDFKPRLEEGRWLAEHFKIHSMIDLSDGLAGDLRHILDRSDAGAELLSRAIPVSRAAKLKAKAESSSSPPLLAALTDGEDFELLFTLAAQEAVDLLDKWRGRFPETKISCIGKITKEPGLKIRDKDGVRNLGVHGYTHFSKS